MNMHLVLTDSVFILAILIAHQLHLSDQTQISEPKCLWNCTNYLNEILCDRNASNCQTRIDSGEQCCLAKRELKRENLCVKTDSKHQEVINCLRPLDGETKAKDYHCGQPMYHPVGIDSSCKSFTGRILSTVYVLTEFQCMDLCIRNLRCVAFNIFKSTDNPRPCQLLESDSPSSAENCLENYIGKKLDREAFSKSYLSPGCTVHV